MKNPQLPQPICASLEGICVAQASKIMSSKWMPMLLYALHSGKCRFGELQTAVGGINPRTLSARLEVLVGVGIVDKTVLAGTPHTEYRLTQKGQDLMPILKSMIDWGQQYPK